MEISRVGVGTWAIGGNFGEWGWGDQDDRQSLEALHRAMDKGINWIDTAACYGLGHAEELCGKLLAERSERPYIFTKCGLRWKDSKGELYNDLSAESVREELELSLKRLNQEYVDLYMIHWPNPDEQIEEAWQELIKLKDQGKIRYLGVSNFNRDQLKRCQAIEGITSLQPSYSLADREIERDVLPYCRSENIGVIHYSPMASGLFSGRMTRERYENLPKEDWRHKNGHFQEPHFTKNLRIAQRLIELSKDLNCSAAELAIAWTLCHPATTASIVGVRNAQQLDGIIGAGDLDVPSEIYEELNTLSAQ